MAAELTTTSACLLWLGLSADTSGQVARSLLAAEYKIRSVCNGRTSFVSGEYTERIDGLGWDSVILKHTPVDTTEDCTVSVYTSKTETLEVASASYEIDEATGILRLIADPFTSMLYGLSAGGGFGDGFRNVQVVYTGGYDAAAIPEDLQQMAIEYACSIYRRRNYDPNLKSENMGRYSYVMADVGPRVADEQLKQALYEGGYARPPI